MELYFHQFQDGSWGVGYDTTQGNIPCILEDYIKDAIKAATAKFNLVANGTR
jgi:hypothetical protein